MADRGVLMTAVTRSAKLAEQAMAVPVGVTRTIRDEVFRVTFAGVDRVEEFNRSTLKVARDVLERADKLSLDAVRGLESAVGSLSKAIGKPCEPAGETAAPQVETETEEQPRARIAAPV